MQVGGPAASILSGLYLPLGVHLSTALAVLLILRKHLRSQPLRIKSFSTALLLPLVIFYATQPSFIVHPPSQFVTE